MASNVELDAIILLFFFFSGQITAYYLFGSEKIQATLMLFITWVTWIEVMNGGDFV